MSSLDSKIELPKLETTDLVMGALRGELLFKAVSAELDKRTPSRSAAELVIHAYRQGAKPWLTALLLGGCRDKTGYATVREILLAAPGSLAESYAGVALAKIGGPSALADLIGIMLNAPDRKCREGAAYGLGALGSPEAVPAILDAILSGKIKTATGGWILGCSFPDENVVLKLLETPDRQRIRLATEIVEACIANIPTDPLPDQLPALASRPSSTLLEALTHVLANPDNSMRPRKRETLQLWINKRQIRGRALPK